MKLKIKRCSMSFDCLRILIFRNDHKEYRNLFRYVTRNNGKPAFIYGCTPDFIPDELKWDVQLETLKYMLITHLNN